MDHCYGRCAKSKGEWGCYQAITRVSCIIRPNVIDGVLTILIRRRLMKAFIHDLRTTILPSYEKLLGTLVPLLMRKIETGALTELLSSLLALFKYVLIPSLSSPPSPLLTSTWRELSQPFVSSSDEGKRMLGEVWGSTIRRMKVEYRSTAIKLMLKSLMKEGDLGDGICWVLVEACQVCCV